MTDARMTLRAMPFVFEPSNKHWNPGHWNAARPEFSQVVNSASLAMPYHRQNKLPKMR